MTIYRNGQTLKVTKGAFTALFEPLGWVTEAPAEVITSKPNNMMAPKPSKTKGNKENKSILPESDLFKALKSQEEQESSPEPEEFETPISEMTLEELIDYADSNGIDIDGLTKKRDIRRAIEAAIR